MFRVLVLLSIWTLDLGICSAEEITLRAVEGRPVTLPCTFTNNGDEAMRAVWTQEDVILTVDSNRVVDDIRFSVSSDTYQDWNLVIDNVHMGDTGTYVCRSPSITEIHRVHLTVLEAYSPPPTTTTTPDVTTQGIRTIDATEGDTVTLPCVYTEAGGSTVIWRKESLFSPLTVGSFVYVSDRRLTVHHMSDEWNLKIQKVDIADSGVYLCELFSKTQTIIKTIHLTIVEKNKNSLEQKAEVSLENKVSAMIGDQISLPCNTSGTLSNKVIWRKGITASPLSYGPILWISDSRFDLDITHSHHNLVIHNVTTEDAGVYICQLVGKYHVQSQNVQLIVRKAEVSF